MAAYSRFTEIIRTLIRIIRTRRPVRDTWMYAGTRSITNIDGAFVAVVRTGRPDQLVVRQTGTRSITRIRVGTVIIRRVTTARTRHKIGMRA